MTFRFASFEFRKCKINFQLNENKVAVGTTMSTAKFLRTEEKIDFCVAQCEQMDKLLEPFKKGSS